ncbi:MAG: hypothetical protein ACRETP_04315, partial [Steroidobacteraceae bacterium]
MALENKLAMCRELDRHKSFTAPIRVAQVEFLRRRCAITGYREVGDDVGVDEDHYSRPVSIAASIGVRI